MAKINKTAILLVCTLLFTGCTKDDDVSITGLNDGSLTKSQKKALKNLKPIPLSNNQYRKLSKQELDIEIDSNEYKVRSGFYSNEDVFGGNFFLAEANVTWPRTFRVAYGDEYRVGYINEDSDLVIPPKYLSGSNFYDGVTRVRFPYDNTIDVDASEFELKYTLNGSDSVYINESDSIIKKLSKYEGISFLDGTTTVYNRNDSDTEFEVYTNGEMLYGGMENVTRTYVIGNKLGSKHPWSLMLMDEEYNFLVDESGEIIIDTDEKFLEFQGAGNDYVFGFKNFSDEYINFRYPNKIYGSYDVRFAVLDLEGNPVSKWIDYNIEENLLMNRYMYDIRVNDGLILIYDTTTEKYGYLSTDGEIVIEPTYTCATIFSEGVACVSDDENYGFINTKGEFVIPLKYPILDKEELSFNTVSIAPGLFDNADPLFQYSRFTEGVCPVRENGKFGLIDKNGEYVVAPIFDELSNVTGGIATGRIGSNYYVLEKIAK